MNSIIKGTSYILAHTPGMVIHNGTTLTMEHIVNPGSVFLEELHGHIRDYDKVLEYWPNQVYIGNKTPEELAGIEQPWHDKVCDINQRFGRFGQIMPQEEFLLLMQACDVFELVKLNQSFVEAHKAALAANPVIDTVIMSRIPEGESQETISRLVDEEHAEGLYHNNVLVGCVRRAHDIDENLSASVMLENLASKASSVLALLHAVQSAKISKQDVDYVIDCSEEACGDMNQRGGGNFAKAAAEIAGLENASGSDVRSFCAGPVHAIIEAAALVASGAYRCVVVTGGGSSAKLGMNSKEHVRKNLPILEDMIGGFAVVIMENDGISPIINLKLIGRHRVKTGSAPQAVIGSLVMEPLDRAGLKITDVDKYSPEMQNPDITKSAGAGDVPLANYKMIAAMAIKRGDLNREEMSDFIAAHGLVGWAPTQGHIPSGVPYIGFARQDIMDGNIQRVMIIGKGSLFLGRMTNLFDGVSFVMETNSGKEDTAGTVSDDTIRNLIAKAMRELASSILAQAE